VDCQQVRDQLGEFLDDEALAEICTAIKRHLTVCPDCRVEVDTLRKTILLVHQDSKVEQIEVPAYARAQLLHALAQEYRKGAPPLS
jgi:predicted anti-sigma-YlaC factor YlaD